MSIGREILRMEEKLCDLAIVKAIPKFGLAPDFHHWRDLDLRDYEQ